jgi:hypothetical protein
MGRSVSPRQAGGTEVEFIGVESSEGGEYSQVHSGTDIPRIHRLFEEVQK